MSRLIAADRIERATLVWNPTMPEWAKASTTDLGSLFGDSPPPLPASEIGRWAIYALAFIPLVGLLVQVLTSVGLSDQLGRSPQDVFDHWAWLLFYLAVNGVLGELDERNLRRGGLKLRGAAVVAGLLVPIYIYASCRTFKRHAGRRARLAYLPLLLWLIAFAAAVFLSASFDPNAPLLFSLDEWL